MNRYGFAGGNPISLIELDGHTPSPDNPVSASPYFNTEVAAKWSAQHPARSYDSRDYLELARLTEASQAKAERAVEGWKYGPLGRGLGTRLSRAS